MRSTLLEIGFTATILWFVVLAVATTPASTAEVIDNKNSPKVRYLEAGAVIDYKPVSRHRGFFETDLRTYCHRGADKTLRRLFESVELQLDIEGDDYTQYEGATPDEVREHHEEQRSLFSFSLFSQKRSRLQLSPFLPQCIGIETVQPYQVRLQLLRIDFWRVIQLSAGIALFVYAGHLSHNALFYYITGVALGICSSFMLLIWLSSKLVPRRTMMYGVLIGGWTIGIYVIQMLWENLQLIVLTYRSYVFWYILITGIVSFFFCYRLGPPKNKRSKNIIKWLLQLAALILIYYSSHFEEATVAIIIITMTVHYFPRALFYKARALFMRRFPPKRRLLTNEEYYEQGVRETTKALDDLRAFAISPDCKQWKVMSKLKNPLRFAAFVEGASHLRDEEILRFEGAADEIDDESELSADEDERFGGIVEQEQIGDAPFMRRRGLREQQQQQQQHQIYQHHKSSIQPVRGAELSEDDDDDRDSDVVEVAIRNSSLHKMRVTSPANNSRRFVNSPASGSTSSNSAVYAVAHSPQLRSSAQRSALPVIMSRSSVRSVGVAKRNSNSRHGSAQRHVAVSQEFSGDSE